MSLKNNNITKVGHVFFNTIYSAYKRSLDVISAKGDTRESKQQSMNYISSKRHLPPSLRTGGAIDPPPSGDLRPPSDLSHVLRLCSRPPEESQSLHPSSFKLRQLRPS
mmetsp:Transcript_5380/g.11111  ORF Transcript_5380/g.11111 Transcript_5380/m.11111 type:complete len:108 (-) Transcript_5380:588-911(-)